MNKIGWTYLFCVIVFSGFLSFCSSNEKTNVRLTQKERTRVDTLFTRDVKVLRPKLDSICDTNFDKMVEIAVDSILIVRKKEEERLRSRLLNQ